MFWDTPSLKDVRTFLDNRTEPLWTLTRPAKRTIKNPNKTPMQVVLPGGSFVILKPGEQVEVHE